MRLFRRRCSRSALAQQSPAPSSHACEAPFPFGAPIPPDQRHCVWVDEFAAGRGVILSQPTLRTGSPRTAAQLAAAGVGVAIVPVSALTPWPDGTVRSFDPPELRDVTLIVAAPRDDLVRRFVTDLKERGLPSARVAGLSGMAYAQD